MIIKKRIMFLAIFAFLPVILASMQISNFTNENAKKSKTVDTVAMPVTSKTIIVDAGHGGEDGGAVSKNRSV